MPNRQRTPEELAFNATVGNNIKYIRKLNNYTQARVGKAIGTTFQQVQKYEKGINVISLDKLLIFCEATNTDLSWFLRPLDKLGKKLYINGRAND